MQIWPKVARKQNNIFQSTWAAPRIGVCTDEDEFENVEIVAFSDQPDVRLIIRGDLQTMGKIKTSLMASIQERFDQKKVPEDFEPTKIVQCKVSDPFVHVVCC